MISSILLAAACLVPLTLGAPSSSLVRRNGTPKTCDVPTTVNYSDLPGIVPGTPGYLNTVQNPYHGLDYGKGWGAAKPLSGPSFIVTTAESRLRGPTDIAADAGSGTQSYALKQFQWYGGQNTGNPAVVDAANTTLVMDGVTDKGAKVQAKCDYVVPLVAVGAGPVTTITTQTCVLPATFARVTDVTFTPELPLTSAADVAEVAVIESLTYVLHKYC